MRVYVTGGYGFLGSRVSSLLSASGHEVYRDRSKALDLTDGPGVLGAIAINKPEAIIHCSGLVGGMLDNRKRPASYLADNIRMGLNILDVAKEIGVKVVMAGSSCMYPSPCEGPYSPSDLWDGRPYEGNSGYGIAKRVLCEAAISYRKEYMVDAFTCVLPNLYGPCADGGESGHFVSSIVIKIREAKYIGANVVEMLGDGTDRRELIYVDDAARALMFSMERDFDTGFMNFGSGEEFTISFVAEAIKSAVGYKGGIAWGGTEGNGQKRKIMDSSEAFRLGWRREVPLIEGIPLTVKGA